MRKIIYLTQGEIDEKVQKMNYCAVDYNTWRAFQDTIIDKITTPFEIYYRRKEPQKEPTDLREKILKAIRLWCEKEKYFVDYSSLADQILALIESKEPATDLKFDPQLMDAVVWAKEFMRYFSKHSGKIDEELMRSWFANAIMAGYDEARRRYEPKEPQKIEELKIGKDNISKESLAKKLNEIIQAINSMRKP
jgi:hypothetical protein